MSERLRRETKQVDAKSPSHCSTGRHVGQFAESFSIAFAHSHTAIRFIVAAKGARGNRPQARARKRVTGYGRKETLHGPAAEQDDDCKRRLRQYKSLRQSISRYIESGNVRPNEPKREEELTLLVDGKHDSATEDQPRQPRRRPAPEPRNPFLAEDPRRAVERVPVLCPRFERLHPRLDDTAQIGGSGISFRVQSSHDMKENALERHGRIDGNDTGDGADRKRDAGRQGLAWS